MSGAERQEAWRDREGNLWLEAAEPDKAGQHVFCYSDQAARAMGVKWPTRSFEDADAEFGPMQRLEYLAGPQEDTVVFLAGGGRTIPVPPDWARRRFDWRGLSFQEAVPGYQVLLLGTGSFEDVPGEWSSGAYIVIRRTG